MGRPPKDLAGMKFGKLTAIKIIEHGGAHKPENGFANAIAEKKKL